MSSLICRKCNNGIYLWDEPTRSDFENRRMKCKKCGNVDTIKEFYEGAKNTEQLVCDCTKESREMMGLDIGDIVISKNGNMYSYAYNPFLGRFMYRRHGKNLEAIWFELSEITVSRRGGNIYERLTTAST